MKRIIFLGPLVSAAIAAAVWFGLPVYAESQFQAALDSHVAARNDARVAYVDARLDYWNDTATIASLTDWVAVPGLAEQMLVTTSNIVISGYDLAALDRASGPADGKIERIADMITWDSFQGVSASGSLTMKGGKGSIEGVSTDSFGQTSLIALVGATFSNYAQASASAAFTRDTTTATTEIAQIRATDGSHKGLESLNTGPVKIQFESRNQEEPLHALKVRTGWESLDMRGLVRGTPSTLAHLTQKNFYLNTNLGAMLQPPGLPMTGDAPELEATIGSYENTNLRFDEQILTLYRDIGVFFGSDTGAFDKQGFAALIEQGIQALERAHAMQTGYDSFQLTDMKVSMGALLQQDIGQMTGTNAKGLTVEKIEIREISQTDALGNQTSVDRQTMTGFDLSGITPYLREMLGSPVTVERLEGIEDYFQQNRLVDVIPAFDLGASEATGYLIRTVDGRDIRMERMAMDAFRADEKGNVTFHFAMAGVEVDPEQLTQANPGSGAMLELLETQGIERLKVDLSLKLTAKLAGGILELEEIRIAEAQLADMRLQGRLAGMDIEKMRHMSQAELQGAIMSAIVDDAVISLTDQGGRELAFKLMAGNSGATTQQMAQGLSQQAVQTASGLGSVRAADIGAVVADFIRQGGSLTLDTEKAPPVPIIQLMLVSQQKGPAALLDLLKVSATHQAP